MRSSRIAIIVIVLLLLIAGSAYALFLSQNTSLAIPISPGQPGSEQSTQCPSNQYAYNESSSGSFECSQVGYNQLNNFPLAPISQAESTGPATNSTIGIMLGWGVYWHVIPNVTGNLLIQIEGLTYNSLNNSNSFFEVRYGTGTPPSSGSAGTGTNCLPNNLGVFYSVANPDYPYYAICGLSGLTLGTKYWFDLHVWSSSSSNTVVFLASSIIITEIP